MISIEKKYNVTIPVDKKKYYIKLFISVFYYIYNISEQSAFNAYKKTLENSNEWISYEKISLLSDYFKRDVYIINYKNGLPYNIGGTECYKKRMSVVLLNINNKHFESIAILSEKENHITGEIQRMIKRQFEHENNEYIQKLFYFLCYPKQFSKKYPKLSKLLPPKFKD